MRTQRTSADGTGEISGFSGHDGRRRARRFRAAAGFSRYGVGATPLVRSSHATQSPRSLATADFPTRRRQVDTPTRLQLGQSPGRGEGVQGAGVLLRRTWENLTGAQQGVIRYLATANRRTFQAWQLKEGMSPAEWWGSRRRSLVWLSPVVRAERGQYRAVC
jgi:hypothetical protein